MLSKTMRTALIITSLITALFVVLPAQAFSLPNILRDKNKNKEEVKEKIASKSSIMKIFQNGRVSFGSGELTAISGTTLTVKKDDKTYTILTDENTKFRRKFWGKSELNEFSIGDKLNIVGKWQDEAKTTILASFVRDVSIQMRHGVFFGSVTSVSGSTLVINTVNRGSQTVTVSGSTKYINRKGETITLNDIIVGHRIRLRGLWNSKNSTITEVTEIKDFSIPVILRPSTGPAASPTPTASAV